MLQLKSRIKTTASALKAKAANANNNRVRTVCEQGQLEKCMHSLHSLDRFSNSSTYACLLEECIQKKNLSKGRLVHAHMNSNKEFKPDISVLNILLNMYCKCGSIDDACNVFDKIPQRNVVSWTTLIAAYARDGCAEEALQLFYEMQRAGVKPNQFTFTSVIGACTNLGTLMDIHKEVIRHGLQSHVFVGSSLIDMYAKFGCIENARDVFEKMAHRNVVSWNTMIAGYSQNGRVEEALELFQEMPERNVVSWTAMIAGFMQNGDDAVALELFRQMHLSGYAKNGHIEDANELFLKVPKRNVVSWTVMIEGYAQNGLVGEASRLFQKMPERNVVSWNVIIAGYVQNGYSEDALKCFQQMQGSGVKPNSKTFAIVLPACGNLVALEHGKEVHEVVIRNALESDVSVNIALLDMYAKCRSMGNARTVFDRLPKGNLVSCNSMIAGYAQNGHVNEALKIFHTIPEKTMISWTTMIAGYAQNGHVDDALKLFQKMPEKNVFSWNVMIAGYSQNGCSEEALKLYRKMQLARVKSNSKTFVIVLSGCADLAAPVHGKEIHEEIIRSGFHSDVVVQNALIDMYSKCGYPENARILFDTMALTDIISWNTMIAGYAQNGHIDEALELFQKMSERDVVSWTVMIAGYAQKGNLDEAVKLFQNIPDRNIVSWNAMIAGYAKNGHIDEALKLFEKMPERNVISWNAIITGYIQNGCNDAALKLFIQMQSGEIQLDEFTFSSALSACASSDALELGKQVHAHIISKGFESNLSVGNALVTMYAKHRRIDDACQVFDRMTKQDVVSWTAMIAGYAENGRIEDAQKCFDKMPIRNVVSWNAMITAYLQNGRMKDALQVFEKIPSRNLVSWNAMITVHACEEALELFFYMHQAGVNPDQSTFTGVLSVCTDLAALEKGKQAHTYIIKKEFGSDVLVCNALITMYGKCGDIGSAHQVLNKMQERDLVSWNAMITGYAQHGSGSEALELFEQMQQLGVKPNHITFIGVLSACSHSGLVNEGQCYFHSMNQDNDIPPEADHYTCMVDLLGRAGHLDEANKLIESMPCQPDAVVWGALLGACQLHVNMEIGKFAAERLFELEPQNAAAYVSLSNIYAKAGRWDEAAKVRMLMRDRGVKKKPGCSWIEVKSSVHTFVVGDRSHSQTDKIYALLESLYRQMKGAGYVPDTNFIAHDME